MTEVLDFKNPKYKVLKSSSGTYLVNNKTVLAKKEENIVTISPAWSNSEKHIKNISEFLELHSRELREKLNYDKIIKLIYYFLKTFNK